MRRSDARKHVGRACGARVANSVRMNTLFLRGLVVPWLLVVLAVSSAACSSTSNSTTNPDGGSTCGTRDVTLDAGVADGGPASDAGGADGGAPTLSETQCAEICGSTSCTVLNAQPPYVVRCLAACD